MRKLIFYLLINIAIGCESNKDQGSINWTIINNKLAMSHLQENTLEFCKYNCVQLKFNVTNTADQNLLLYNFNRFFNFPQFNESNYCDTLFLPAERYVYIYRENGERVQPLGGIPDSINWKPFSTLERQIKMSNSWFRSSRQVIRKGETIEFTKVVNLKNYNLISPGIYRLKLMYYQHDVVGEITQEELEQDIRKNQEAVSKVRQSLFN